MTWSQSRKSHWSSSALFAWGRDGVTQALMQVKQLFVQQIMNQIRCNFCTVRLNHIPRWFQGGVMCSGVPLCTSVVFKTVVSNRVYEIRGTQLDTAWMSHLIRYTLPPGWGWHKHWICVWMTHRHEYGCSGTTEEGAVVWLLVSSALQMTALNDKRPQESSSVNGG